MNQMNFNPRDGIVRILRPNGETAGTGFVLTSDGLIATCSHVVQSNEAQKRGEPKPEKITVVFRATGESREAQIEPNWWRSSHKGEDVAILRVNGGVPKGVQPLPLGSSTGTSDHPFKTFGFPKSNSKQGVWGVGNILGETEIEDILVRQLSSDQVTVGFSGAPVVDQLIHRVVGMVTSITPPDTHGRQAKTAFITPIETLRKVCSVLNPSDICPYRDLEAFTEDHAEFFVGRERIIDELVSSLKRDPHFLAVFGPSGCGKSSVVQAGLIPQLRKGQVPGSDQWKILVTRPTNSSFEQQITNLDQSVEHVAIIIDQFEEIFVSFSQKTCEKIITQLTALERFPQITLIVVMRNDFYSLFVHYERLAHWKQGRLVDISPTLRRGEVVAMVKEPANRVGLQFEDEGLIEQIVDDVFAPPLQESKDTGSSTVLPLLESALTQLWKRREDGVFTRQAYQKIGGVTGALKQWADDVYGHVEEKQRPLVKRIFTDLVNLGDKDQHIPDNRRRRKLISLVRNEGEKTDVYQVVELLVKARLLVMSQDTQSGSEMVEIIHDALLWEWWRVKQWIEEDHLFLAWHQKLEEQAQRWKQHDVHHPSKRDVYRWLGRRDDRLLEGRDLTEAENWLTVRRTDLSEQEQAFIEVSKKQQRRTTNRVISILSVFLIIVTILGSLAQVNFLRAEEQRQQANTQKQLAETRARIAQSQALAANARYYLSTNQVDLAFLLSKKAYQTDNNYESRDSLFSAIEYSPHLAKVLRTEPNYHLTVSSLTFSPDGQVLISSDGDPPYANDVTHLDNKLVESVASASNLPYGGITLWNMKKGQAHNLLFAPIKYPYGVNRVAFSPNGQMFASAGRDGVWLWNAKTGMPLAQLQLQSDPRWIPPPDIAFSPDGKFLAGVVVGQRPFCFSSPLYADSIFLWNLVTKELLCLPIANAGWSGIAFSPDGKLLAVTTSKHILLFDMTTGKPKGPVDSPLILPSEAMDIKFSPDGKLLVVGGSDGTITLWDVASRRLLGTLSDHKGAVNSLAFNSDGSILASGGADKLIRLWDPAKRTLIGKPLIGHSGKVASLAWSPDGQLASGGDSGTIILWDVRNVERNVPLSRFLQDTSDIQSVAFSPNGKIFASGDSGGKIVLRDGAKLTPIDTLSVPADSHTSDHLSVNNLIFSSDGQKLAAGIDNGTIIVWDATVRKVLAKFRGDFESARCNMVFSPNGRILAVGGITSGGGLVTLLDVATQQVIKQFTFHSTDYYHPKYLAFSPDGQILIDHIIYDSEAHGEIFSSEIILWDVTTGKILGQPLSSQRSGHPILAVALSPDGHSIAAITEDGAITLWDVATRKPITQFYANDGDVHYYGVGFTPNGKWLAVMGDDYSSLTVVSLHNVITQERMVHPFHYPGFGRSRYFETPLVISPDEQYLVLVISSNTDYSTSIIVSDIGIESWLASACNTAHRNFTADEWKSFGSNEPYQKICPDFPVHESEIKEMALQAHSFTQRGDKNAASAAYTQATQWAAENNDPVINDYVCWYGGIDQFAKEVLPACEQALEMEPYNGMYHDSRGLARALLGDRLGAIEDFQFFVTWATKNNLYTNTSYIAEQQAWIHELEAGHNPFDAKTLEALRNE